jgi:hypothetical protein
MTGTAMKTPIALAALAAAVVAGGTAQAASHALTTFIAEQDLNKDGKVAKEEYQAGRDQRFAATDSEKDGGLQHDEYVGEYTARLLAQKPSDEDKARQLRQVEVRFGVLDSNKDAKISKPEYDSSGWAMFAVHDADKNGRVDAADANAPKKDGE